METDSLSFEFLTSLFSEAKDIRLVQYILQELDEPSIVEKLIKEAEVEEDNDRV